MLCACLHQHWHVTTLPHSRHTAWAYPHTLLHKAGRSFRYNAPINTTFHSQHLRWRAAAPQWRIPADSGCTPPWLIHCEPETGGKKTVYTETSIWSTCAAKLCILQGSHLFAWLARFIRCLCATPLAIEFKFGYVMTSLNTTCTYYVRSSPEELSLRPRYDMVTSPQGLNVRAHAWNVITVDTLLYSKVNKKH